MKLHRALMTKGERWMKVMEMKAGEEGKRRREGRGGGGLWIPRLILGGLLKMS